MNSPKLLRLLHFFAAAATVSGAVANWVLLVITLTTSWPAGSVWMVVIALWAIVWCFVMIAIGQRRSRMLRESVSQIALDESMRLMNERLPTLDEMRANRIRIMAELERLDRWREAGRPNGSTPSGTVG